MEIILYNPISKNGKTVKEANKLANKFMQEGKKVELYSLLDLSHIDQFLLKYDKDDSLYIVGGDGTLNHIVNRVHDIEIRPKVYLYKSGTGNDFYRSLKKKNKLIEVTQYLKKVPSVQVNEKERYFLNGVGIGLDGLVCHKVNHSIKTKNQFNYMRNTFSSFIEAEKFKVDIMIDGKAYSSEKAWFVSVMNAPYFGAGMKIASKADRMGDTMQVVIVEKLPKWLLTLIFPTIYLGIHTIFKRYVKVYTGKQIEVSVDKHQYMQIDGDVIESVGSYKVNK